MLGKNEHYNIPMIRTAEQARSKHTIEPAEKARLNHIIEHTVQCSVPKTSKSMF